MGEMMEISETDYTVNNAVSRYWILLKFRRFFFFVINVNLLNISSMRFFFPQKTTKIRKLDDRAGYIGDVSNTYRVQ